MNYICLNCKLVYGIKPSKCNQCGHQTFHETEADIDLLVDERVVRQSDLSDIVSKIIHESGLSKIARSTNILTAAGYHYEVWILRNKIADIYKPHIKAQVK
jgi:RNA polymerase subunit RPABC4/transcription elongation factor Spt4